MIGQRPAQDRCPLGIVRAVQQEDLFANLHCLQSTRPVHLGQAGRDLFTRHRQLRLQTIDHGLGQAGVGLLMFAEQRQVGNIFLLAKRGQFRALRWLWRGLPPAHRDEPPQ